MSSAGGGAGARTAPRIAVTGMWSNRIHGLRFDGNAVSAAILRSVIRAGGEPLALFAESPRAAVDRLRGFDALLVPGGADVDPARYGEAPHPASAPADFAAQDDFEAGMMAGATELGLPVLAICRGFQLLNVEHGGSLQQDLPEGGIHRNGVHEVRIDEESRLAAVLGVLELPVSSYHHQGVARVGTGLRAIGTAPDGMVEALEPEDPNVELIAVQWHPEDSSADDPRQQALFDWLIERARVFAERNGE